MTIRFLLIMKDFSRFVFRNIVKRIFGGTEQQSNSDLLAGKHYVIFHLL